MKDKKLVQMLMSKVITLAGMEKQAASLDDLCGTQTTLAHLKSIMLIHDWLSKERAILQTLVQGLTCYA